MKNKQKIRRFFHFDDDTQKWGVYELISPEYKTVESCVKWSGKNRQVTKGGKSNEC